MRLHVLGRVRMCSGSRRTLWRIGSFAERSRVGKKDVKYRSFRRSALDLDIAAVVLNDLLHYGQAQPCTVLLALAHKRFKQCIADWVRDATAAVADADIDPETVVIELDIDAARSVWHGLTRVKYQIEEDPLQFAVIKPAFSASLLPDFDSRVVEFWIAADRLHGLV